MASSDVNIVYDAMGHTTNCAHSIMYTYAIINEQFMSSATAGHCVVYVAIGVRPHVRVPRTSLTTIDHVCWQSPGHMGRNLVRHLGTSDSASFEQA